MKLLTILLCFPLIFSCSKKEGTSPAESHCTMPLANSELEKIQLFPSDNALNTDISAAPVDSNSANIMAAIPDVGLHPDFGSGLWNGAPIGIPFILVCGSQPKVPVTYRANSYDNNYGNESDQGPFPIPANAPVEGAGSGDSHVLVCDIENKILYELYNASKATDGWEASSGASWDLKTNYYRTEGFTSADAAGLPILPLLLRYDEVVSGKIDHAIRFTLSKSHVYKGYVFPASHKVNGTGAAHASLPMGGRLRLKASVDISSYPENIQVILTAMKTYGIVLADIGSDMFISGAPDERWDNDELNTLKKIKSSDFEVIQMGLIKE